MWLNMKGKTIFQSVKYRIKASVDVGFFSELPMLPYHHRKELVASANGRTSEELFQLIDNMPHVGDLKFEICTRSDLPEKLFIEMFNLLESNMKSLYERSSWGWDREKKVEEMNDKACRYIVATNEVGSVVGFCHFRFDMERSRTALYCYEIQVAENYRRQGVGSAIIEIIKQLAAKTKILNIFVTVFKFNENSLKFFVKQSFVEDTYSPKKEEHADYYILSKQI
ncbi:N-alpha-acetyltransferase 40 [Trichinella zimbabwensis]|uniref:N-alpha-acetyltransferase 40 n=1 Tax=Trichinella zimbabwensis TaxID=268475 RepID=A0A0V1HM20_9BILA|nr:N-alpha-acetyltransferase 40 [Trichinella zimbabwensis]